MIRCRLSGIMNETVPDKELIILKKLFVVLFLIITLAAAGIFFYRMQPTETPVASDFIPGGNDLNNLFLMNIDNVGGDLEKMADLIDLYTPDIENISGKGTSGNMAIVKVLTGKLRQLSPVLKDMQFLFTLKPNGVDIQPYFWGSIALKTDEPVEFTENIMDDIMLSDPDLVIIPYTNELGKNAEPLYQIMDTNSSMTVFTALYRGDPSYMLLTSSEEELSRMVKAAEDPSNRLNIERHYEKNDYFYAQIESTIMEAVIQNQGRSLRTSDPFVCEGVLFTEGRNLLMKMYSNAADIFLTPEEKEQIAPLSGDHEFIGGGKVVGYARGSTTGFSKEYFNSMLAGPEAEKVEMGLAYMEKQYGITLQDMVDLFTGEIVFVMGGEALSPVGEIPGIYMVLKPAKSGIVEKFTSVIPQLQIPVQISNPDVKGWENVYSLNQMITLTVAGREKELLAGILNANQLNVPSEVPENLAPLLKKKTYGICAFSVKDMRKILDDLALRMQVLRPDPSLEMARKTMNSILGKVETLACWSESLEESVMRITLTGNE